MADTIKEYDPNTSFATYTVEFDLVAWKHHTTIQVKLITNMKGRDVLVDAMDVLEDGYDSLVLADDEGNNLEVGDPLDCIVGARIVEVVPK